MKKTLWTAEEICAATHSALCSIKPWEASGLAINSKEVQEGDLFIALKGAKVDSHDFLEEAFARGAVAAVVEYAPTTEQNFVVVRKTHEAILDIGRAARNRLQGTIIGVTGSAGKTSTKDMLALCLETHGKTFATKRSFNSTITAPLSLASAAPDIQYGVFEIGMSHPGEISKITRIVRPHIAVVTNIGPAHLENFGSLEGIAEEKGAIFSGLPSFGTAIIPGDGPHADQLRNIAQKAGIHNILSFGENSDCQAHLLESWEENGRFYHKVSVKGHIHTLSLSMPGKHWALNGLICLLATHLTQNDLAKTCKALEAYTPSERRGKVLHLQGNRLLVDESYNANPLSMRVALESFAERSCDGKKVAALGDMLELGPNGPDMHKNLFDAVLSANISILITHGPLMRTLHKALEGKIETHHFETLEGVKETLLSCLAPNDAVIIKASLGMGFIKVVHSLKEKFSEK